MRADRFLDEFVKSGGIKYLPKQWQGALIDDGDDDEDEEEEETSDLSIRKMRRLWYNFLSGTLKRTERGLRELYMIALSVCTLLWLLWDILNYIQARRLRGSSVFLRGLTRILVLNAMVVALGYAVMRTIDESNWAKDIAAGRSFNLPEITGATDVEGKWVTHAVLPTQSDVLIAPEYAAETLAGYGRVLEYAHPGNVRWNDLVRSHGPGYLIISGNLQLQLCQSLLDSMRKDSRFLKQGREREYLVIEDNDELCDICHRDLVATTDRKIFETVRQLNSLKTTASIGRFANTAMQTKVSPRYLKTLEQLLVPQRAWRVKLTPPIKRVRVLRIRQRASPVTVGGRVGPRSQRSSIPIPPKSQEPFPLAWVREQDVVEAMFDCMDDCKFHIDVVFEGHPHRFRSCCLLTVDSLV